MLAAEASGVLIYQLKIASVGAHFDRVEKQTAEFFDRQDWALLKNLAARGETARALINHAEPHFTPSNPQQRTLDLSEARRLALSFADLEKASADLDFVVDLPPQWLD